LLEPLDGKTVLIVGAGGGVGSFATQFAANAGARVIANVRATAAERMRGYGASETIDHTAVSLPDAVRAAHPDGIDALIDVASDPAGFAVVASLVRAGGTAVTTKYVADLDALAAAGGHGDQLRAGRIERAPRACGSRPCHGRHRCASDHSDRARGSARDPERLADRQRRGQDGHHAVT